MFGVRGNLGTQFVNLIELCNVQDRQVSGLDFDEITLLQNYLFIIIVTMMPEQ